MREVEFTDETLSVIAPAELISEEQARAIGRAITVLNGMLEDQQVVVRPDPEPTNRWRAHLMRHVVTGAAE